MLLAKTSILPVVFLSSGLCFALCGCSGLTTGSTAACGPTYAQQNTAGAVGINIPTYGGTAIAQSFTISNNITLKSITLPLTFKGSIPSGNYLTLTLQSDAGGSPSGVTLATATYDIPTTSTTSSAPGFVSNTQPTQATFTFTTPAVLAVSTVTTTPSPTPSASPSPVVTGVATVFWIVVDASYPQSATNYASWAGWQGTGYYTSGQALYETSTPGTFSNALIGVLETLDMTFGC